MLRTAQVESVGEGVTNVKVGDHVIPLYTAGAYSCTPSMASFANIVRVRMPGVQVLQERQDQPVWLRFVYPLCGLDVF